MCLQESVWATTAGATTNSARLDGLEGRARSSPKGPKYPNIGYLWFLYLES